MRGKAGDNTRHADHQQWIEAQHKANDDDENAHQGPQVYDGLHEGGYPLAGCRSARAGWREQGKSGLAHFCIIGSLPDSAFFYDWWHLCLAALRRASSQ